MDSTKEALMNAETAFSNRRFNEALSWYQKVLDDTPDDVYALSRAGAICVPLGKFEDALRYFKKAKDIDPENGDNYFNYANACFFNKSYQDAFLAYVEAERIGCSEDVTPRLYYQMALLCSIRNDTKSSLAYFAKCETVDKEGSITLSSEFISEKLKLYMMMQEYDNAEKCAAQLVAIQPTEFRNYMVYYSILMAHKKYALAELILTDAEKYAELTEEDKFVLTMQKAAFYMAKGDEEGSAFYEKAVVILKELSESEFIIEEQRNQVAISLSEVYLKMELYDEAIDCLSSELSSDTNASNVQLESGSDDGSVISEDEIEKMLDEDVNHIQNLIDIGALDDDLGMYAETEYDADGNEIRVYDEKLFAFANEGNGMVRVQDNSVMQGNRDISEPSVALRERKEFSLLSAYLGKEDFQNAAKYAAVLKHSDNKYYIYYGIYATALIERKLEGNTEKVDRKYAEALAFFRSKMFADPNDSLAAVFRARLYVEQGKKEKALEIANLLSDSDKEAILRYAESYNND